MSRKNAVLSYEEYRKRFPGTQMTKTEYEKKYLSNLVDDVGRGLGQPVRPTSQKAQNGISKEYPIHHEKHDPDKGFDALFKYMDAGKVNSADDASVLIRRLGYNEHEFANHLIKKVSEGKQNFERLDKFVQLGVIPKSYVQRQIGINDMEKSVPPKFHEQYGIRSASAKTSVMVKLLDEIDWLEDALTSDCETA